MELSDEIKKARHGAAANPFQGTDKKVLFVCSMGILRSATAARIYAKKYNTRAAGTYDEALIQVNKILLDWADEIVFMGFRNYEEVVYNPDLKAALIDDKVIVLNIPDVFEHMNPKLIQALKDQYEDIN